MSESKKGGLLVGESHENGGIKIQTPEGQIEAEGGEVIITKKAVEKHCEELSKINQDGGGVAIPSCGTQKTDAMKYEIEVSLRDAVLANDVIEDIYRSELNKGDLVKKYTNVWAMNDKRLVEDVGDSLKGAGVEIASDKSTWRDEEYKLGGMINGKGGDYVLFSKEIKTAKDNLVVSAIGHVVGVSSTPGDYIVEYLDGAGNIRDTVINEDMVIKKYPISIVSEKRYSWGEVHSIPFGKNGIDGSAIIHDADWDAILKMKSGDFFSFVDETKTKWNVKKLNDEIGSYYIGHRSMEAIFVLDEEDRYKKGGRIPKNKTMENFYYLKIGNIVKDEVANSKFRISSHGATTIQLVRETAIDHPDEITIRLESLVSNMNSKKVTIEGLPYETDRDKALLLSEVESINMLSVLESAEKSVLDAKMKSIAKSGKSKKIKSDVKDTLGALNVLGRPVPHALSLAMTSKPRDWKDVESLNIDSYGVFKNYLKSLPVINLPDNSHPSGDFPREIATLDFATHPFIGIVKSKAYLIDPEGYNYARYAVGIPQYMFEKGGKIQGENEYIRTTENQYDGKTAQQIWNGWNKRQVIHFLEDHMNPGWLGGGANRKNAIEALVGKTWLEIPVAVQKVVKSHIEDGQYKKGGKIRETKLYKDKVEAETRMKKIVSDLGGWGMPYVSGMPLTWIYRSGNEDNPERIHVPEKYHKELDKLSNVVLKWEKSMESPGYKKGGKIGGAQIHHVFYASQTKSKQFKNKKDAKAFLDARIKEWKKGNGDDDDKPFMIGEDQYKKGGKIEANKKKKTGTPKQKMLMKKYAKTLGFDYPPATWHETDYTAAGWKKLINRAKNEFLPV